MTDPNRPQAIEDAFWGGVRSVLLIDDEFPTYESLAASQTPSNPEAGRLALKLWKGFRDGMHLACDIASKPPNDSVHLSYRDFIVLDYELSKDDGGKVARKVLADLTSSTRQNLVLVYTLEPDLQKVKLGISASLAGLSPLEPLDEEQNDEFQEWKRDREKEGPSNPAIYAYLQGDKAWLGMINSSADDRLFAERWLRSYLPDTSTDQSIATDLAFEVSGNTGPQWVRRGSVFVALMNKDPEHTAETLRDGVIEALKTWDPSFMRILLGVARNRIVEQGLIGDDRVLRDAETEAGWMFYLNEPVADNAQRRERLGLLYGRLVDDLLDEALLKLIEFSAQHGSEMLPDNEQVDPTKILDEAMQRIKIKNAQDRKLRVIHKLNHYLAFERLPPTRIRAGTVFSNEEGTEFGVVVTPDCDLQPGRNEHEDAKSLGTVFRIVYRPAVKVEVKPKYYKEAHHFTHIFLNAPVPESGGDSLILSFFLPKTKQIAPTRVLYVENTGTITNAHFLASRVERHVERNQGPTTLNMSTPRSYRVIGQLRDRYALRLLDEAGHYLSRVGVDFVCWPPR